MKKSILYTLCACTTLFSAAQEITGNWQGTIAAGGKNIRLIFHISKNNHVYQTKFDSPDQNAYGLSASQTNLLADSVLIAIDLLKGGYRGKWDGRDEIKGILTQGAFNTVSDLKRMADADMLKNPAARFKPQTPQPPFPYNSEEVNYENTTDRIRLAGTFTKPSSGTKFPVVLLITGSGPQDRDETIGMHKSFAVLADALTRLGIAVLRVDDRGVGKSTGDFFGATSADFATDVMAGIDYLKSRTDIDTHKIGLMGHSEGGLIAPYVAARSKDVAFVVMLAGPAVGGKQTMHFQAIDKLLHALSKHDQLAYQQLYDAMFAIAMDTAVANHAATYVRKSFLDWKKKQPDSTLQNLVHGTDEEVIQNYTRGFNDFKRPWWRFFLTYDLTRDLEKIQVPLLALNGEKDEQVDPKANLALIQKILTSNRNPHFKTVEVRGVNHLFQHCKACGSVTEYLELEETFDPATITLIGNWIKEQVQ